MNHPYTDPAEIARDAARNKAEFCLRVGIAPSEYDHLTQIELAEFAAAAQRLHNNK